MPTAVVIFRIVLEPTGESRIGYYRTANKDVPQSGRGYPAGLSLNKAWKLFRGKHSWADCAWSVLEVVADEAAFGKPLAAHIEADRKRNPEGNRNEGDWDAPNRGQAYYGGVWRKRS